MPIYLDNSATSHPKPETVYRAADHALREIGANPGRGGHRLALDAARLVYNVRESVANFFAVADPSRIIFTANATEAINLALFGLLVPGDRVVTTTMEHNAMVRPLAQLEMRGIEVVKVQADQQGYVEPDAIFAACAKPTRLVALSHCSNVSGTVQSIEKIGPWCRENGVTFLVDAAQSAGLIAIDVEQMAIDLLAVPGHKSLLGPPGTGFLYIHPDLQLQPLLFGGTGSNSTSRFPADTLPERFEVGTMNVAGIAGLGAAIEFLQQETLQKIFAHEHALMTSLRGTLSAIDRVSLYAPLSARHVGPLSFNIDGLDPAEVGFLLEKDHEICVRVGLHCAPEAHRSLGTFPQGTVRVSPGYFTTRNEIDILIEAIKSLAGNKQ
ncbi:MAG: aminotransferase class V-fold PLP-dependent enzyme [Desulfuromonadaceae bacterium]|nr:aminotransferase class V-fold PLP-dependent enzyme [Desulfuromonadaceae bacterium]